MTAEIIPFPTRKEREVVNTAAIEGLSYFAWPCFICEFVELKTANDIQPCMPKKDVCLQHRAYEYMVEQILSPLD